MGSGNKKVDPKKTDKKKEKKSATTVFKAQIHCQACLTKIKKAVAKLEGIELISVDEKNQKITVLGKADAQQVMKVVKKTGKNVELIQPKEEKKKEYKKDADEEQEEIEIGELTPDYELVARRSEKQKEKKGKKKHKEEDEDEEEIQIAEQPPYYYRTFAQQQTPDYRMFGQEQSPDYRTFARKYERNPDYPQSFDDEALIEEDFTNNCSVM